MRGASPGSRRSTVAEWRGTSLPRPVSGGWTDEIQRWAPSLFILGVILAAALARGGFYARDQAAIAVLLGAAAIVGTPLAAMGDAALRWVLVPASLLAVWVVLRSAIAGTLPAGAGGALLIAEVGIVLGLCSGLDRARRQLVVMGLLGLGLMVAAVGWAGVVWRVRPLALSDSGLWRAGSTITYANAAAAFLIPLVLVAVSLRAFRPRSVPLAVGISVGLTGIVATLSRAGLLALLVGVLVLVVTQGRVAIRMLAEPAAGAAVAVAGFAPSLPVSSARMPGVAVAALLAGITVAGLLVARPSRPWILAGVAVLLVGIATLVVSSNGRGTLVRSLQDVWRSRGTLASPGRSYGSAEALRVGGAHALIGAGPGQLILRKPGQVWHFVHDEYLQVWAELGSIGVALMLALLVGGVRLLWRARASGISRGIWPGVAAACIAAAVHAGFDFDWHVPVIPLTLAALVGVVGWTGSRPMFQEGGRDET